MENTKVKQAFSNILETLVEIDGQIGFEYGNCLDNNIWKSMETIAKALDIDYKAEEPIKFNI